MLEENLKQIKQRRQMLTEKLNTAGLTPDEIAQTGRALAKIEPVMAAVTRWEQCRTDIIGAEQILADKNIDPEMRALAEEEKHALDRELDRLTHEIRIALLPQDEADERNVILEIRAGTGGEEAALFAGDVFRMYHRYGESRGWRLEVLQSHETGIGGFKEIICSVTGAAVFARLKYESGVHRVQRIPQTESGGRIHTSAATVAILPEAVDVDITLKDEDMRIDTFRAQGAGGQHVNTTDSAVRITHLPTGIVVQCQDEKSQHKNRDRALKVLKARLYDHERQQQMNARAENRKSQVGTGDRSERIRTYNYPQNRITDHRIGLTLYKLDKIIAGDGLDEIIDALIAEHQARLFAVSDDADS